ncbi:MAG TPA: fibronectin type III domain-containing protein [Bacteroidia bacterium]
MSKKQVALKLSKLSVPLKIDRGNYIVSSMTGNPSFPSPVPSLATIKSNVVDLEAARVAALGGGVEDTSNMHDKADKLELSLKLLAAYVESIANENPDTAETVIQSAGMEVKVMTTHSSPEFKVSITENPGEVRLVTKHNRNSTFIWQISTKPGEEGDWKQIDQTTRSRITVSKLDSGTRYYFRVARVDKSGIHPWSHVLNIIAA